MTKKNGISRATGDQGAARGATWRPLGRSQPFKNIKNIAAFNRFQKITISLTGSSFCTTSAVFWCHLVPKAQKIEQIWTTVCPRNASFWPPVTTEALHAPKCPQKVAKSVGNCTKYFKKELNIYLNRLKKRTTGYTCMLSTATRHRELICSLRLDH